MTRLFLFFLSALLPILAYGQSIAPTIEWDFQSPSTVPGFENDDNWVYTPMQASDGSIVAVGFSDKYNSVNAVTTGIRHPAILKYVPGPIRTIQWEAIPTHQNPGLGITLADAGRGGFLDVFESNESGTKYLYACGTTVKSGTSGLTPVVAKFLLSTGALVYFKQVTIFASARFTRMSPIITGSTLTAIYVAGESTVSGGTTKATIFKIKPSDGTLNTGFDADGWRQYSAPAPNDTKPTFFKDLAFAPDVSGLGDGFIAVGSVLKSGGSDPWVQPDRDVFMARLRTTDGNVAAGWPRVFTESSLGVLYTDLNSPEVAVCAGTNQETALNEEGFFH